ncbi:MAG: hypothetical protein ACPGRC_08010 [Salibacteraceae bacterium]
MRLFVLLAFFSSIYSMQLHGQGCSDAGFCTIDGLKPDVTDSTIKTFQNQIKIGFSLGNADHGISAYGIYLEYNRVLSSKVGLDLKITALAQNGNNIQSYGASDIFITGKYKVSENFKGVLGFKLPLSNSGNTNEGLPLPMDYQSSLGTIDLIVGVGLKLGGVELLGAFQQPLTQNANQFLSGLYPEDSELRNFQSTNNYKRKGDVLLRVSYPIKLGKKIKFTPSLLPIYHLNNDLYTDELNMERTINGSQGLTLNGNLYFDYLVSKKSTLQFNTGNPFIVREVRPDGLTRSYVLTIEYKYRF